MQREILFKAKRIDNGEWVQGNYLVSGENHHLGIRHLIAVDEGSHVQYAGLDFYEVNPDTICQYTGIFDKNGNKIFEFDKVKSLHGTYEVGEIDEFIIYVYNNHYWAQTLEIVGNINDKPQQP